MYIWTSQDIGQIVYQKFVQDCVVAFKTIRPN